MTPTGAKYWRQSYRFDGKQKPFPHGVYPEVSLKEAREKRDIARKEIAAGIDPGENRKARKEARLEKAANSFEAICRKWLEARKDNVEPAQTAKTLARMEKDVFPLAWQQTHE